MKNVFDAVTDMVEFSVMQNRKNFYPVIYMYDLEEYEIYFRTQNKSLHAPYHNEYHAICMVLNCFEGSIYEELSFSETRSLLAAALFHDFDHTGGKKTDDVNISLALDGLRRAQEFIRSNGGSILLSPQEMEDALSAIQITKYPYETAPVSMIQKIIRDADLMQVYEESDYRLCKQFRGLKEEVEILHGNKYSKEEWADGCKSFNDAVVWHTDWAKEKAEVLEHESKTVRLQQLLLGYK